MLAREEMMAQETTDVLKRLARALRDEAEGIKAEQLKKDGVIRPAVPADTLYQRGVSDGLLQGARLLDDGEGG